MAKYLKFYRFNVKKFQKVFLLIYKKSIKNEKLVFWVLSLDHFLQHSMGELKLKK